MDNALRGGHGRISLEDLNETLQQPSDPETHMAVAAALGYALGGEDGVKVTQMLVQLLGSDYERVRFRAALSVVQRADTLPSGCCEKLEATLRLGLEEEESTSMRSVFVRALNAVAPKPN